MPQNWINLHCSLCYDPKINGIQVMLEQVKLLFSFFSLLLKSLKNLSPAITFTNYLT